MVLDKLTENAQKKENRNRNFEIKQTMDSMATVHSTYVLDVFKIFAKFSGFLLFTHHFLLPLSVSFGVPILVYWFLYSRPLALAQWLCGPCYPFLLCACSCLSSFRSLCYFLDLPWFWFLVGEVVQYYPC